ncbi:DUF930 domain-containing protein [Mesorhizobium abyssinicae]|uniref:DUF930 domain-containing protein n=1 Tax=Mesorhizobium abyssinicae TaxID=1209958 RepID=UPI00339A0EAF
MTLHLIVVLAVGFLPTRKSPPPPTGQSITVEILSEQQAAATAQPAVTQSDSKPIALPTPIDRAPEQDTKPAIANELVPQGNGMVRAKELFSAKVLADPLSKEALVALRLLGTDDRIIQLCNVEAMEQVQIWKADFQPDFVVAYAMADTKLSGLTLRADGAALRSKRHWYNIKFKCEVTQDLERVVAFEFSLGPEIPKSEWETYSLPVGDGPSD